MLYFVWLRGFLVALAVHVNGLGNTSGQIPVHDSGPTDPCLIVSVT